MIEARNEPDAATIGDIFVTRCLSRGAAGVVTDGGLRDTPAIYGIELPVYHRSSHAATLQREHLPLEIDVPVACAGVLVMPGDVIVGDAEGAIVLPAALAEEVIRDAAVQEEEETFAVERVAAGESTIGLFPLSKDRRPDFEAWKAAPRRAHCLAETRHSGGFLHKFLRSREGRKSVWSCSDSSPSVGSIST